MRIAASSIELDRYLNDTIKVSQFTLTKQLLADQSQWTLKNGVLSHQSGGFFHVVGVVNEENQQEHLALYQPQSAFNGLILCRQEGQSFVLLQARTEPGNCGVCQYGPTIQSTPANYMKLHGGKSTPYLDLFFNYDPNVRVLANNTQYDLGKRYYQKSKTLSYIEVPRLIDTEENMIWVSLDTIKARLSKDNYFNTDLRSMLAVFDWEQFESNHQTQCAVSNISYYDTFSTSRWNMCAIEKLNSWHITPFGIEGKDTSVLMYQVSCSNREVAAWSQPLFDSKAQGQVVLYVRRVGEQWQALLQNLDEFGISTGVSISPSIVTYPEEPKIELEGNCLVSMVLSEEGGRFYQDENCYEVRELDENFIASANQYWVSLSELKSILKSSNLASIQLRVISSLLLNFE